MPKQKTRRSIAKRFRITKTGKVIFRAQNLRHLRRKKHKGSVRAKKKPQILSGRMARKIIKALKY